MRSVKPLPPTSYHKTKQNKTKQKKKKKHLHPNIIDINVRFDVFFNIQIIVFGLLFYFFNVCSSHFSCLLFETKI